MNRVFIDTSALYALENILDSSHAKAGKIVGKLSDFTPCISANIISESVDLVSRRLGKKRALSFLEELRSGKYNIISPDEDLIETAEDIFKSILSKNVSYVDCVSFAVMRSFNIQWAFSFDLHFKKFGFKRLGVDGWPK